MSDLTTLDWNELYKLQDEGQTDEALDLIYNACCSFDIAPDCATVDAILAAVDLNKITNITIALAFLSAPCGISNQLPSYKPLLEKVRVWLKARGEPQNRIDDLLRGFDLPPMGRFVFYIKEETDAVKPTFK